MGCATGYAADEAAWRKVVIASGENLRDSTIDNYMPPHIILRNLHGDIVQLFTQHGVLRRHNLMIIKIDCASSRNFN